MRTYLIEKEMERNDILKREDSIYARQSANRMDSISIESQIEYCQYETKGEPCRIFFDKGFSGKNTERPQFQEMMEAIKRGEIKRVICYKLDRCSRSVIDFVSIMEVLQKYDVEFVSCTEKFDTSTPTGRAMLNICIVFAQLERETIQMRIDDAYKSMSRKGFFMGGRAPYGFRREPYYIQGKKTSHFIQEITEASTILHMSLIFQEPNATSGDVIRELNRLGVKNPNTNDGSWSPGRITAIVCNPLYVKADRAIYNFFKENGAVIHNPPEDFDGMHGCYLFQEKTAEKKTLRIKGQHLVIAPHDGIVPSDVWLRCRKKVKYAGESKQNNQVKLNWLSGKIKCGKCGYALIAKTSQRTHLRRYICSKSESPLCGCVGIGRLSADEIEQTVLNEMYSKVNQFPPVEPQPDTYSYVDYDLQKQIDELQAEIDSYMRLLLEAPAVTAQYINERVLALDRKKSELSLEALSAANTVIKQTNQRMHLAEQMEKWSDLSIEDKMAVMDVLIERITVTEEKVQIVWKI